MDDIYIRYRTLTYTHANKLLNVEELLMSVLFQVFVLKLLCLSPYFDSYKLSFFVERIQSIRLSKFILYLMLHSCDHDLFFVHAYTDSAIR